VWYNCGGFRGSVGMEIPWGFPRDISVGMGWIWGLKSNLHGNPGTRAYWYFCFMMTNKAVFVLVACTNVVRANENDHESKTLLVTRLYASILDRTLANTSGCIV